MAKILVVDDSDTKRALYKDLLERSGYSVIEAKDGEEGMLKARTQSPDVVITDLAMPKVSGFEMVKILKGEEKTRYVPIICVSATYKDMESKLRALTEAGAEECFYMPENMSELLIKVEVMLRIRKIYLDLLEKNRQLKQFNDAAVGREIKMIELKDKIRILEEELANSKKQK